MAPRPPAGPSSAGPSRSTGAARPGRTRLEDRLTRAWLSRGPLARARWPRSLLYGAVVALRRLGYRSGLARTERLSRPVLVVGNRVAGGAGKTPTALAQVGQHGERGWRPGVVSRGHGRREHGLVAVERSTPASACGDEPLLLRLRGGAPVVVGEDRVAAARALLAAYPDVDVVVADDGLQHLRLGRELEVLVFDARGAGNGWLLPAGPLREPLDAPSSAPRVLTLYNADAPSTPRPGFRAWRQLAGAVALADWWAGRPASPQALEALRGRRPVACAGIAQPARFFGLLRDAGVDIEPLPLADHADYAELPWPAEARDVVLTEKDAAKLAPARVARERPATRVWVAPLDFAPEPAFFAALDTALAPHRPPRRSEG